MLRRWPTSPTPRSPPPSTSSGDLYELDGAVSYRVIAYRNAAKAVRDASVSVMGLSREGRVTELPGVGRTLEEKLRALDDTGDIPAAQKLRAKFPSGLISVMHLPGFGPKRARRLYDELGIDSLDALRAAAEAGRIRGLRGFGPKAEENLIKILADGADGTPAPRFLLSRAMTVADQIVGVLRAHPAADRVEVAGSLRRLADAVKDIDIIATTSDPAALAETLAELELVESVQPVRRRRRARDDPLGHEGRPQGRRARTSSATCCSTSRAPRRTTSRCARPPSARACTSPSTGSSTTRPARRRAARPRRRSTSASASSGSRPSCARAAASSSGQRRAAAGCRSS